MTTYKVQINLTVQSTLDIEQLRKFYSILVRENDCGQLKTINSIVDVYIEDTNTPSTNE